MEDHPSCFSFQPPIVCTIVSYFSKNVKMLQRSANLVDTKPPTLRELFVGVGSHAWEKNSIIVLLSP